MLQFLAKISKNFRLQETNGIDVYNTEIGMLLDSYTLNKNIVNRIRENIKSAVKSFERYFMRLVQLAIFSIIILIISIIYSIIYDNYLILLSVIIFNLYIINHDLNKILQIFKDIKTYVVLSSFLFLIFPYLSMFVKLVTSIAIAQIIMLKLNYRNESYVDMLKKSKAIVTDYLNSPILKNTRISKQLQLINEKYYNKVYRLIDNFKILRIIVFLLPLAIYPSFKILPEAFSTFIFITTITTLLLLTKTYYTSWINPKIVLYYCVTSILFWLI